MAGDDLEEFEQTLGAEAGAFEEGEAGLVGCRAVAQVMLLGPPAERALACGPAPVVDGARQALSTLTGGGAVATVAGPSTLAVRRVVADLVARAAG